MRPGRSVLAALHATVIAAAVFTACGQRVQERVPPAPVFRPQAIVVPLGSSGQTVTLMTTAAGVTLDGQSISSGHEHTGTSGNLYILTLADGRWLGIYRAAEQDLRLGSLDESVLLVRAESGTWLRGEDVVTSGETTVAASNGSVYVLALAEGRWMASYRAVRQDVPLGSLGETVVLERLERGDWFLGEDVVASGETTVVASNRSVYVLALAEGRWMASYRAVRQTVDLGSLGESVVLDRLERGDWLLGEDVVASGETTVAASNGSAFTLVRSGDDHWSAQYRLVSVDVPLGQNGKVVTLERSERATWWIGAEELVSGETQVTAGEFLRDRPVFYRLALVDGVWIAIPRALEILNASSGEMLAAAFERDDRTGYELDGAAGVLDADGVGEIRVTPEEGPQIEYRVWKEGSALLGFRHDTMAVAVHDGRAPRLVGNDPATPQNEEGTVLQVGGGSFLVGELLDLGLSTSAEGSFVEPVWATLATVLQDLTRLRRTIDGRDPSGESLRLRKVAKWKVANEALVPLDLGPEPFGALHFTSAADDETAAARLEAALKALAHSESFAEAVAAGVFGEGAMQGAYDAAGAFAAMRRGWSLRFGTTERTRFGAWSGATRETALGEASLLDFGAFAYTPLPNDLAPSTQLVGSALYLGRTVAVTSEAEPQYFSGDVRLVAQFHRRTVRGQIWNLQGPDEQAWTDSAGGVLGMVLPVASLDRQGRFSSSEGGRATLLYVKEDGPRPETQMRSANWQGQFVGEGERSQPGAAIGTWELAAAQNGSGLRGGFGAEWEERIVSRSGGSSSGSSSTYSCSGDCGQLAATYKVNHSANSDGIVPSVYAYTKILTLRTVRGPLNPGLEAALNARDWMAVDLAEAWATGGYSQSSDIGLVEEVKHQLGIYRERIKLEAQHIVIKDNWHPAIAQLSRLGVKNISPESNYEYAGGLPRVPLTDPADATSVDKAAALEKLHDAIAALGSLSAFQATLTDPELFEFAAGTDSDDLKSAFEATQQNRYQAYYAHTDYTRFGIWSHRVRDTTSEGEFAITAWKRSLGFEEFAYSPLEGTPYDVAHGGTDTEAPEFPQSGTAVYDGRTIAGTTSTGAVTPPYQGDIELRVFWANPDGSDRTAGDLYKIRVGATITNLVDSGGEPWRDGWGDVAVIKFHRDYGPEDEYGARVHFRQVRRIGAELAPDPILPGGKMNRLYFDKVPNWSQSITRRPANMLTSGLLAGASITRQEIVDDLGLEDPTLGKISVRVDITYAEGTYESASVPSGRSIAAGELAGEFLGALQDGPGALIGHWRVLPNRWLPNDTLMTTELSLTEELGPDRLLSWSQEYNDPTTAPNRKEWLEIKFAELEGLNTSRLGSFLAKETNNRYATDSAIYGVYGADLTEFLSDSFPDP